MEKLKQSFGKVTCKDILEQGTDTHAHALLTLHGYGWAQCGRRLKKFTKRREKKKNNINKTQQEKKKINKTKQTQNMCSN